MKTIAQRRERTHKYYEKHKTRILDLHHKYYRKHRKEILAWHKAQMQRPEKRMAARANRRKLYAELKRKLFLRFGKKCKRCGFSDIRALQLDHLKGNGSQQRQKLGCIAVIKLALKKPKLFQILCANCQWIKRAEKKEGPVPSSNLLGKKWSGALNKKPLLS